LGTGLFFFLSETWNSNMIKDQYFTEDQSIFSGNIIQFCEYQLIHQELTTMISAGVEGSCNSLEPV
jgi:hypothetical protein